MREARRTALLILLSAPFWFDAARAEQPWVDQVPNGPAFGCNLCHQNGGGSPCNLFGAQVAGSLSGSDVDWPAIHGLDADGDGFTNGVELGDPAGSWRPGDPHPDTTASHPAKADSTPCGNGAIDGDEQCDGQDLGGSTCESLGHEGGTLTCDPATCQLDESGCGGTPSCGNDKTEDGEECDGSDLGGASCGSLGYAGGTLTCEPDTCRLVTDQCQESPPEGCGNGTLEGGEQCDGSDLGGASCLSLGYGGGDLACALAICQYDKSGCFSAPQNRCGDGVLDSGETCDGDELGGASCASLGFGGGTLICDSRCRLVVTGCKDGCGNYTVEAGEECDGGVPADVTCVSAGFTAGTLVCSPQCLLSYSSCESTGGVLGTGCSTGAQGAPGGTIPGITILLLLVWVRAGQKPQPR